jgi:hypothetical protein
MGQPLRCESMTELQAGRLADLIDRVRLIVGDDLGEASGRASARVVATRAR